MIRLFTILMIYLNYIEMNKVIIAKHIINFVYILRKTIISELIIVYHSLFCCCLLKEQHFPCQCQIKITKIYTVTEKKDVQGFVLKLIWNFFRDIELVTSNLNWGTRKFRGKFIQKQPLCHRKIATIFSYVHHHFEREWESVKNTVKLVKAILCENCYWCRWSN